MKQSRSLTFSTAHIRGMHGLAKPPHAQRRREHSGVDERVSKKLRLLPRSSQRSPFGDRSVTRRVFEAVSRRRSSLRCKRSNDAFSGRERVGSSKLRLNSSTPDRINSSAYAERRASSTMKIRRRIGSRGIRRRGNRVRRTASYRSDPRLTVRSCRFRFMHPPVGNCPPQLLGPSLVSAKPQLQSAHSRCKCMRMARQRAPELRPGSFRRSGNSEEVGRSRCRPFALLQLRPKPLPIRWTKPFPANSGGAFN